jgi:ATP phosphoribosyltransferase regulatory subunit
LRSAGLSDLRIGLGDVGLTDAVLDASGVPGDARSALRATAATRDLVGWRDAVDGLELAPERRRVVADLMSMRGGPEVLREIRDAAPGAAAACRRVEHVLESLGRREVECTTLIDLSVLRDWPYYSGIVFEAYTPAVSAPVAMGGRYDRLAARFGRDRPAVGFGIALQPLNRALVQQNGGTMALLEGVVLAGGLDDQAKAADEGRAAGITVVAAADRDAAETAAEADGWRYVAWRDGDAFALVDRSGGPSRRVARLSEVTPSRP